jgi:catechol 2,3-dioxygenase-like lactoylglutathione lyase family enzyme
MEQDGMGLDHAVINVHSKLDEAADTYRRLGFTLTERGHHTLGTSNHLAVFQRNYLELLGVEPGRPAPLMDLVSGPMGITALAFKVRDPEGLYRRLIETGLPAQPPQSFSRPVVLAEITFDARFTVVQLSPTPVEGLRIFFCHHLTPQFVWRDEWQEHANGAVAIDHFIMAAPNPVRVGEIFGRILGDVAFRPSTGGLEIDVGGVRIHVLQPDQIRDRLGISVPSQTEAYSRLLGIGVKTKSLNAVANVLSAGGLLPATQAENRIAVVAANTMGVIVEFMS